MRSTEHATSPESEQPYLLHNHIHLCSTHDGVVILDLENDKYFGLSGKQMRALSKVVQGWPPPQTDDSAENLPLPDAIQIADLYVQRGILTRDRKAGKAAVPVTLTDKQSLIALGQGRGQHIAPRDLANFIVACSSAALALRLLPLKTVVRRVSNRKTQARFTGTPFDPARAARLIAVFRHLRSFTFTARHECLFHALSLTTFLARYGLFPEWVIGVKTCPFAAHSWVQHEHFVLDATPEEVCFYTPILSV